MLHLDLGDVDALRAHRNRRLPVVLTREEVGRLLSGLDALPTHEPYGLTARLMYGAGLRLLECCRLRVKDVDLKRGQIVVRQGKGDKDRVVMLPAAAAEAVAEQTRWRLVLHERDRERGEGWVWLPDALDRKYPEAPFSASWQFLSRSRTPVRERIPRNSCCAWGPRLERKQEFRERRSRTGVRERGDRPVNTG